MPQLRGKTALVAGAGRNNGKAMALAFAREGADLILLAREKRAQLVKLPLPRFRIPDGRTRT
jgi:NAD(P)-dependent dehydrogenase (short-subunit alcohol dehydrogenase family)